MIDCLADGAIVVDKFWKRLKQVGDRMTGIGNGVVEVALRDDSGQSLSVVKYGKALVLCAWHPDASHVRTAANSASVRSVTRLVDMISRTWTWSSESAWYSAGVRMPRRAIFSVMIELRITRLDDIS